MLVARGDMSITALVFKGDKNSVLIIVDAFVRCAMFYAQLHCLMFLSCTLEGTNLLYRKETSNVSVI